MARKTNRREFVQVAGLAASGLMATARPLAGAVPEPQARPAPRTMGARFRALLNGPEPLVCPGAYDVLTARLIEIHGFKSMFIGSSAVNQALLALPDQAVVTVSEILNYDSIIASNVDIPVLADVDDFGATALNIYRFAKEAERRGIGCAAFDDRMPLNRATAWIANRARLRKGCRHGQEAAHDYDRRWDNAGNCSRHEGSSNRRGQCWEYGKHCVGRHRQSLGRVEGHGTNDCSGKGVSGPGDGGEG